MDIDATGATIDNVEIVIDNTGGTYPRAFNQADPFSGNQNTAENFQGADIWMHDASYLRLKEVELGYNIILWAIS